MNAHSRPSRISLDLVWPTTALSLTRHIQAGRAHLITADTFRWITINAMQEHGLRPDEIRVNARLMETGPTIDLLVLPDTGITESVSICFQPRTTPRLYRTWAHHAATAAHTPAHTRWVITVIPRSDGACRIPDTVGADTTHPDPTTRSRQELTAHCVTAMDCLDNWRLLAHTLRYATATDTGPEA